MPGGLAVLTLHLPKPPGSLFESGGTLSAKIISKNQIQLIGSIDEASFQTFSSQLRAFEKAKVEKVFIELSSGGGNAYDALAFYSRMRLSPCHITILVHGLAASAAVLVVAGADERLMTTESWVMVHEDTVHKLTAKITNLEKHARHMRRLEVQWNQLLASRTKLSEAGWEALHKAETYLTPSECLRHGLVGRIV